MNKKVGRFICSIIVLLGLVCGVFSPKAFAEELHNNKEYDYRDSAASDDVTITVEWDEVKVGEPTTFHVSATGGTGSYKFLMSAPMYSSLDSMPYTDLESVADPSRGEWLNYTDWCDSQDYTFTMTASGTYYFNFSIFYPNQSNTSQYLTLKTRTFIHVSDSNYPSISTICNNVVKKCNQNTDGSDYERALYLHDWLLEQLEYDNTLNWCSAESALTRGKGTCQAYTNAYIRLLNAAGIENSEVRDIYDGHTWNAVKLDGDWYQVDCTWDDSGASYYGFDQRHLYFGLTDELMAIAHKGHNNIYTASGYGTRSTNLKDNYFVKSGIANTWANSYVEDIETNLDNKVEEFTIRSNSNNPESISGIQNGIIAYALNQRDWGNVQLSVTSNSSGFSCKATYPSSPTPTEDSSIRFIDVDENTFHYVSINWLADTGISTGWENKDGTRKFRPLNDVARADMAAFLQRLAVELGYLDASFFTPTDADWAVFTDVTTEGKYHQVDILWLAQAKITEGWTESDGSKTFRPFASIKRADMAAFLRRLAAKYNISDAKTWKPSASDWSKFSDVTTAGDYHQADILWLAHAGISTGFEDGTFRPFDTVKRCDMAAFLERLAKLK